jgi:hypothetical protein
MKSRVFCGLVVLAIGECTMSKGVIYVMTTVVPGLLKIGKTGTENFKSRMYQLEGNGYSNVVGLKRKFAIEVDDYDDKETLLQNIFAKSRVSNSELFALDVDLVVQLLSSFEGNQIYPEQFSKEEVFTQAATEYKTKLDWLRIPNGEYQLNSIVKGFKAKATMRVEDGSFTVLAGAKCAPVSEDWMPEARKLAVIENNMLKEDISANSPSTAGWIVLGRKNNGWKVWKNSEGNFIDIYRDFKLKGD